jgi:hypothetical protein
MELSDQSVPYEVGFYFVENVLVDFLLQYFFVVVGVH